MTVKYQTDIHQLLSPNDNKCHGIAKTKWKQLRKKRMVGSKDGVETSLILLKCLLDIEPASIKEIFQTKFFLPQKKSQTNDIRKMITEDKKCIYDSKIARESMGYFHRWMEGKLRDGKIKCHPGINMEDDILIKLNNLLSS